MRINYENLYGLSDLGCTAALITIGFDLLDLDTTNPKRIRFLFESSKKIEAATQNYWVAQGLQVNAREYFQNLRMLKSRIYNNNSTPQRYG